MSRDIFLDRFRFARGLVSKRRLVRTIAVLAIAVASNDQFSSSYDPWQSEVAASQGDVKFSDDPISSTLFDCSGLNAIGYSDPDRTATKRAGPSQNTKITGYIRPGIGQKIGDVVRTTHIEGYSQNWTLVIDNIPGRTDSLRTSYVLTASGNSVVDGAIRANIDFGDCKQIIP